MNRTKLVMGLLTFSLGLWADTVQTIPFRALLAARNETTPVVDANATGRVTVLLHVVQDNSGKIISGSFDFSGNYSLTRANTLTAMHIHKAPAGVAGGIVVPVPLDRTDSPVGTSVLNPKQVNFTASDAAIIDAAQGLLNDPSGFYFNIHTVDAPSGAMRGQLEAADAVVLGGLMSPLNENPPIQNQPWSAISSVFALRTRDANGVPTSGSVIFDVNYAGFPADTNFTGFHLHFGAAAVNGPVTIDSRLASPLAAAASGSGNLHYEVEVDLTRALAIDTLDALFNNPSSVYINVHTTLFGGGAARSQLRRMDHAAFNVTLNTAEEVPAPAAGTVASAPGMFHVFAMRNADGSVAGGAALFDVNPRLPGSSITAMHMHDQVAGVAGPVTIDSRFTSLPNLTSNGVGNIFRLVTVSTPAAISSLTDLLTSPEKHYLNVHTTVYPAGIARTQLGSTSVPGPVVSNIISSVSDATRTTAASGSLMTIFGRNLTRVTANLDGFPPNLTALPRNLNGTSVTVGGTAAPVLLVAQDQIVVQTPFEATAGNQPVVVTTASGNSTAFQMPVAAAAPNIFFDGQGGIVTKANFQLVRQDNPAVSGEALIIFSTGLGQTTPAQTTGAVSGAAPATQAARVTVGGVNATVIGSVAAPGFPGLYQTAFLMPSGVPPGLNPVVLSVGSSTSNTVRIATR